VREIPRIVSLDDHVIDRRTCGRTGLRRNTAQRGPRVVRDGYRVDWVNGNQVFAKGGDRPETDWWPR